MRRPLLLALAVLGTLLLCACGSGGGARGVGGRRRGAATLQLSDGCESVPDDGGSLMVAP